MSQPKPARTCSHCSGSGEYGNPLCDPAPCPECDGRGYTELAPQASAGKPREWWLADSCVSQPMNGQMQEVRIAFSLVTGVQVSGKVIHVLEATPCVRAAAEMRLFIESLKCDCKFKPFTHQYRHLCKRCELLARIADEERESADDHAAAGETIRGTR